MYIALISIIVFICVLLILVVLAQNPKGGGLSSQFGGSTSQLMGVKRTGDLLEKLTWGFAIALVVLTLGTHMMVSSANEGEGIRSINEERARQSNMPATPSTLPGTSADTTAAIPGAAEIPGMIDTAND
ncbi:preprotein translocase subunit SecG [Pontibacter cellulosilyticus]|uniref:Protein-export membrane protein SecG n=1 Tax=Pontibacter cellulosilyticus TaxID=1720253 RepID=A0A923N386_9BACT|nr:preprotein translocase subunit SecG [Pontibacter cellulosilyticus]MBC5991648.1 preprotein translocase subunit SecG [Pontibacter cellulosilyticus]